MLLIRSQFIKKKKNGGNRICAKQGIKRKDMDLIEEILISNGFN